MWPPEEDLNNVLSVSSLFHVGSLFDTIADLRVNTGIGMRLLNVRGERHIKDVVFQCLVWKNKGTEAQRGNVIC